MLPSIKELRAAAGGLENLTDEEIISATYPAYQQYYGSVDEFAKSIGYEGAGRGPIAAGLSSGLDSLQGLGYSAIGGVADAFGVDPVRDWANRRASMNNVEAELNGRPDLERIEDQSWGSALPYAGYQIAKQVPLMAGIMGAQLIPGVGQAAGALGLSRLGAVAPRIIGGGGLKAGASFAARRAALAAGKSLGSEALMGTALGYGSLYGESVEGGNPDPYGAAALAPLYGLSEAAVPAAVRGALRAPTELAGGLGTRMLKAGALGALGESGTEGIQNEMEMSMRDDISPEEAYSRRLNSMIAGGIVGGPLGSLGGIRGPRTVDQGPFDLTNRDRQPQVGYDSPFGDGADRIREMPGFTGQTGFNDSFLDQARQGIADRTPTPAEATVVSTQQAGNTPTNSAAATAPSLLTASDQFYANELRMPVPQGKARRAALEQLYNYAVDSGVPLDSPALHPYWNQIGNGSYFGTKQQDKLRVLLQNAIAEHRRGQANVSAPSVPAGQPAASSAGGSVAPVGGVGNTGPVSVGGQPSGGNAGNPQPAAGQVAAVADTGGQRATPLGENTSILQGANQDAMARARSMPGFTGGDPNAAFVSGMRAANPQPVETTTPAAPQVSGEPVIQRKRRKVTVQPGTQANAYVTPEAPNPKANAPVAEDGYVDDEDAWEDFRPDVSPPFKDLSPGLQQSWADLRRMGKLSRETAEQITAEHELDDTNETGETIRDVINQIFDKRDADIIHDVFVGNLTAAQVAEKYGLDSSRVRQIAGTGKEGQGYRNKKIKAAQEKYGWTDEYVRSLMGDFGGADSDVELDTDMADGRSAPGIEDDNSQQRDIASFGATGDLTLGDVGMSTISSEGGSTGYKDTIGDRKKALTKEEIDKLNTMRDGRAQLERDLEKAQQSGDEELVEKIQGDIDEVTGKIEKLESGKATPQELAASLSQQWYDLTAKADELEGRVQAAIDAGLDTLTDTKKGKRALAEVQQEIEAVRAKAAKALGKAKALLEDLRKASPATENKAVTPKKEAKVEKKASGAVAVKPTQDSGQTLWEKLRAQSPNLVAYDELTANERGYLTELADRTNGKPVVKNELGLQELVKRTAPAQLADNNVIDVEARVIEETVGRQVAALPAPRIQRLENHYGVKSGTQEFLERVKEDVVRYATEGAQAVSAAIRDIIKAIHAGVLSVAMIFNPNFVTPPQLVMLDEQVMTETREVRADVPANAQARMSEGAKEVYSVLYPSIKGQLQSQDKLMVIVDKPNARMFVFKPDGSLLIDKKVLLGAAKGDLYKGNNDVKTNRITPAGLFTMGLRDATRSAGEAKTAGEYDFQKVFVLDKAIEGEYSVTLFHSVWTKEKDAQQRLNALKNENASDSRYSFGCINVDKDTYGSLVKNHLSQMDGAALFIVPDNSANTAEFLKGATAQNKSGADGLTRTTFTPATETITSRTTVPAGTAPGQRGGAVGREQRPGVWARRGKTKAFYDFGDMTDDQPLAATGGDWLADLGIEHALDYVSDWETFEDTSKGAIGGEIVSKGGRYTVRLNTTHLQDSTVAAETVTHEVGHAVDMAPHGGIYSSQPEMSVEISGGKVVPVGKVARELHSLYQSNEAWRDYFEYPFDLDAFPELGSSVEVEGEIFAQLFSLYTNPRGRAALEKRAPASAAFMAEVINHVQSTRSLQLQTEATVAQRTVAFRNRNAQQGDQVDQQTAGRAGQAGFASRSSGQGKVTAEQRQAPTASSIEKTVSKLPKQAQKPARMTANALSRYIRKGVDALAFTSDLAKRAVDAGIEGAEAFQNLMIAKATKTREYEREVERIADMYAQVPERDRGDGPNSVNQFIFDSTQRGQWGYDSGKFKANDEMAERFDKLDEKSQAFVKAVFAHGDRMLALKKQTVLDFTSSEYDAHIKALTDLIKGGTLSGKKLTDAQEELAEVQKDKKNDLEKFSRLFSLREGKPYAPIKRFGPYAVVAKSATYMQAVEDGDNKAIRKLEQDANHYHVTFTETAGEAESLAGKLIEQGAFEQVQHFERSVSEDGLFGNDNMMAALTALRSRVNSQDRAGTAKLKELVSQMYLQELAENSARKSEMRRRGVVGEVDMLRSFTTQGRADAHFLASTRYGSQLQDVLQAMHKQSRGATNRLRASEVLNEVVRRYQQSFDYAPTPWLDKLRRMSSVYFLATSPAYYMQNLTQPWMMSVPAMAGAHDYAKVTKELFKAYGEMKELVKSGMNNQMFNYAAVPGDVRSAIQELVNRGKIDIGMDTELGEFRIEGRGFIRDNINRVDKALRTAVQKVESINRLSTAMTAYRLERAAGKTHEQAIAYADRILTETHGDYTAFNAPRAFNSQFGKVALQFRKFQLIQLTYYAKLINDIVTSPRERRAAAKMLAYSLGHTALLAGVRGLPGFAAVALLASTLFGDDDEPYDLEAEIRKAVGDPTLANLIMRGAPTLAGADISGKVGAGNMLSILPFSDADLSTRAGVAQAVGTLLGGASLGMATRMVDGLGLVMSGDLLRGTELLMPKGVGDAVKAYRVGSDGLTLRNGDILLSPDEVSTWESALQAMGIQSAKQAVVYEQQQRVKDMDKNFQDRSSKIKSDYVKAVRNKDTEAMAEARQAWTKMQEARARNGYTRQPLSNLLKAPQEQAKRERNTSGGVQFNKQNRAFVESQV